MQILRILALVILCHSLTENIKWLFYIVLWNLKTITDRTLSANLKELEADGLIERKEYQQIPPKVEYSLSPKGASLMKILDLLCIWGEENRPV